MHAIAYRTKVYANHILFYFLSLGFGAMITSLASANFQRQPYIYLTVLCSLLKSWREKRSHLIYWCSQWPPRTLLRLLKTKCCAWHTMSPMSTKGCMGQNTCHGFFLSVSFYIFPMLSPTPESSTTSYPLTPEALSKLEVSQVWNKLPQTPHLTCRQLQSPPLLRIL